MKSSLSKWLVYTLLVGSFPALVRFLVWAVATPAAIDPIAATDLISFGLVVHASIINEVEHLPSKDRVWKTVQNGVATAFITLYGALYALAIVGNTIDGVVDDTMLIASTTLFALLSLVLAAVNFHHLAMRGSI